MNTKLLVVDLQYFPSVDYIFAISRSSYIIFDECLTFRKMSFRNRTVIAGANGPINLTVPVLGGRDVKEKMRDIKIDNSQAWKARHLRSIVSSYNRSPFFEFFSDSLGELFEVKFERLQDWNLACMDWLVKNCGLKFEVKVANHPAEISGSDQFEDFRDRFFPRTIPQVQSLVLPYRQVFEDKFGFIPHLSILDFLFCNGPIAVRNLGNIPDGLGAG